MTSRLPTTSTKRTVVVVGAVVVRDGLVLCAERGPGAQAGLWEFPGGKVEPGETPQEALVREIREELGCTITVGDKVVTTVWEYENVIVDLTTYWAALVDGEPVAHEHASLAWVYPADLSTFEWAPADVEAVLTVAASPG